MAKLDTRQLRHRRHIRIRSRISGTAERPRLSVFRSLDNIYAQVIDDSAGNTVVTASTVAPDLKVKLEKVKKKEAAELVGALVGKLAMDKGIREVVFDRGGYKYHGRVKALADGARKAGLKF